MFQASMNRASTDNFQSRALALLSVSDMGTFKQKNTFILRDYLKIKPWLEWWLCDSHAQTSFPPFRQMKTGLLRAIRKYNLLCSILGL
ncbi:uncharacterized protein BJ212DRAFT_87699 [Suillus subaureus]|uniref:Uncharacterized protein n=1 Tax=Suillus subaureus TaxID=48587 RepID=A0A9P7J3P0_9AGAM|nr:uncharacterized protein BJ212DRAFT_87699 [Suillus subaureus]KAG1801122.1 hypothetical protein BJ212DRAFT_87699 [Suillus subaureus]